jgi:hypothetical protein
MVCPHKPKFGYAEPLVPSRPAASARRPRKLGRGFGYSSVSVRTLEKNGLAYLEGQTLAQ